MAVRLKEKFSKWEKTRKVTFKKDYYAGNKLLYKAGSVHFMHESVAEKVKDNATSGSVVIEKYNREEEEAKLIKAREKAEQKGK